MKILKPIVFAAILCITIGIFNNVHASASFNQTKPTGHKVKHGKKKIPSRYEQEVARQKNHKDWYDDCTFTNKYSVAQRLKKYPYSKAVKILAVSYKFGARDEEVNSNGVVIIDTGKYGLNIDGAVLDRSSLIEIKELNKGQIDKLTAIVYNTNYRKPSDYPRMAHACYNPRNAFVFYDKNGKVFDYLEICFECERWESMSENMTIGVACNQKLDILKQYFVDMGIKYGTIDTN